MPESKHRLAVLRQRMESMAQAPIRSGAEPCGIDGGGPIDLALGGGLARGCVHEAFAASPDHAAGAAGFVAIIAQLLGGLVFWLRLGDAQRRGGLLHGPGLAEMGCDPARLILGVLPDPLSLLRAAAEIARCNAISVAVVELWGDPRPLDLTASRRLALAAESSGVTVLMLRIGAEPSPSAARSRWSVASAPAAPLAANAPGHPTFDLELLRQRGRPAGGRWRMEWNRDLGCFEQKAPLSGAVLPFPAGGSPDPDPVRHRRRA